MKKLRIWRLVRGKTLAQVAKEVRLPAYIISAIERGEVAPSDRWTRRFEEAYGAQAAAELLAPAEATAWFGPALAGGGA